MKFINDKSKFKRVKLQKTSKVVAIIGAITITAATLTSCGNMDMFDTNYTFTHAVIFEEGKTTIVPIKQWTDYEGEQLQIITEEGNVFLTSSINTKLFNENNGNLTVEDFAIALSGKDTEIGYLEKQTEKVNIK